MSTKTNTKVNVSCDCKAPSCVGITITVPASMLVKPNGKTTPRYIQTVTHNLVQQRGLFGYPVV